MKNIAIHTEYITLGQFLKLADCISTGGQAKAFLQDAVIQVNGEPENRRGRKLVAGDQVNVEGCGRFVVVRE
ncbi:S4 domain-containing protein YaaA [Paenibacillus aurantius]|uniref:S4 domain-containing protein YaaA n=1 Tax=Paenibacillus aurantius TaxID=2918900 RepID=A0AA96LEI2_9BACL|nr:S4 domain-containing protein YaaA [Paenibacillus aurantius]WJH36229.1 S4 domain-containing protein YaaA [Paenibacillus sp. CC-CFT747]WNQ11508.1 S4 domain-containing protein YaaA [Paenibacillus aurantius]